MVPANRKSKHTNTHTHTQTSKQAMYLVRSNLLLDHALPRVQQEEVLSLRALLNDTITSLEVYNVQPLHHSIALFFRQNAQELAVLNELGHELATAHGGKTRIRQVYQARDEHQITHTHTHTHTHVCVCTTQRQIHTLTYDDMRMLR